MRYISYPSKKSLWVHTMTICIGLDGDITVGTLADTFVIYICINILILLLCFTFFIFSYSIYVLLLLWYMYCYFLMYYLNLYFIYVFLYFFIFSYSACYYVTNMLFQIFVLSHSVVYGLWYHNYIWSYIIILYYPILQLYMVLY